MRLGELALRRHDGVAVSYGYDRVAHFIFGAFYFRRIYFRRIYFRRILFSAHFILGTKGCVGVGACAAHRSGRL